MSDLVISSDAPLAPAPPRPYLTIEMAIAAWLDAKGKRSGSKKTISAYTTTLASFRAALQLAQLDLDSDPRAVMLVAQAWAGNGKGKGSATAVKPTTYNRRLAILSSFYTYATERELLPIQKNPIRQVEKRRVQAYAGVQALDYDQLKRKLASINRRTLKGQRDYALLAIYVTTGRRLSEVARLTWANVQLAGDRVTLHFTAKGGKQLHDQLAAPVATALLTWLQRYHRKQLGELAPETPLWVSLARNDTKGHLLTLQAIANLCEKHLGIRKVHLLRHTFARAMEDAGAKVSTIQERLGHSDLTTTGRYLAALHSAENPYNAAVTALLIGE